MTIIQPHKDCIFVLDDWVGDGFECDFLDIVSRDPTKQFRSHCFVVMLDVLGIVDSKYQVI
jgi:hypothetical protein